MLPGGDEDEDEGFRFRAFDSQDHEFRYLLEVAWGRGRRTVLWILHNPPQVGTDRHDAEYLRCLGFSLEGYDRMVLCSLFAKRVAVQEHLRHYWRDSEVVGPENDRTIDICLLNCDDVVVAWGSDPYSARRAQDVLARVSGTHRRPLCLGLTAAGDPRRPTHARRNEVLRPFEVHGNAGPVV